MWVLLAIISALCLGVYDVMKKLSVDGNNVLGVLFLNTLFGSLLMLPVIIAGALEGNFGLGNTLAGHGAILIKSLIVLSSWLLGYASIKHLPLTIAGPVNASRPVMVLVGALLIFGERLNLWQWIGVILGFASLYFISRVGSREGVSFKGNKWVWMAIGATVMGAVSALYDKYLLTRFEPLEVQAWYSLYQFFIMGATLWVISRFTSDKTPLKWRWAIPLISVFLTIADLAYFYSLSIPSSMIAIVSMIRRGSVIVPFFYGVFALHEKNVRMKLVDLTILLVGLTFLVVGSL
ncbi:MAG: DMT family transporter [Bacteroides sp.]|nr:DMT family transporter [Barnesiella sp.]MBD5253586.1 DMT family transporter [Barnesiella sp.]MBD5345249.1 DMT family transporter [Bacteroides sp.]MBD5369241.1 DMT family transporter [Bacteroides sp.]MDE5828422.1 DMT family transporter [Duncaniella sp.]